MTVMRCFKSAHVLEQSNMTLTMARNRIYPFIQCRVELGDSALLPLLIPVAKLILRFVDSVLEYRHVSGRIGLPVWEIITHHCTECERENLYESEIGDEEVNLRRFPRRLREHRLSA